MQPIVLQQGENTVPIFLNPPSKADYDTSNALRLELEQRNVDLDYLDLKIFQIKQENYEFDPPALPTEQSTTWGYLWGNKLIRSLTLLENLKPQDEYLRGYLEKTSDELSRKMRIHYRGLDWETRKSSQGSSSNQMYRQAKVEALADFIVEDRDAFLDLYKNNSYISSYDEGDALGYNIPSNLESKLENLMKFDWDQTVGNPDVTPYVTMLGGLMEFADPKLRAVDPQLAATMSGFVKSELTSSTARLGKVVSLLETTSASLVGEVAEKKSENLSYLLSSMKADGAVKAEDAGSIVHVMRGVANPNEAATIKGKSDADLLTQFADVDEDRVNALVKCVNASKGINDSNVVQVVVSGVFNNCPSLFNQFAVDDANVKKFTQSNQQTVDNVVIALQAQNAATQELAKSLDVALKSVENWLQTSLSMDKPSLAATCAALPSLFEESGAAFKPWYVQVAETTAASSSGLAKVEATALKYLLSNPAVESHPGMTVHDAIVIPGAGNFSGRNLRKCAEGFGKGTFSNNFAQKLADYLSATGKATPAQADLALTKVAKLPEFSAMANKAAAAQHKYEGTESALCSVYWNVEDSCIPELQMAYTPIPHPSFDNVNAY